MKTTHHVYDFDREYIGIFTLDRRRSTTLIRRPPGLTDQAWHQHACRVVVALYAAKLYEHNIEDTDNTAGGDEHCDYAVPALQNNNEWHCKNCSFTKTFLPQRPDGLEDVGRHYAFILEHNAFYDEQLRYGDVRPKETPTRGLSDAK